MNRPARPHPGGPRAAPARAAKAPTLHPRNRHQGRYDFTALLAQSPALRAHVVATPGGERSIDFSRPESVRALNAALLRLHYGVRDWQIPPGYLCPPVPGRADYVHGLADLLEGDRGGTLPRGPQIRALDIGTGANLIYPLIGHAEYGWQFVASDIDRGALDAAARILDRNPDFRAAIELRLQPQRGQIFAGLLREGERFDLSLCNPPFHASAREAAEGSQRKWRNLGRASARTGAPLLNFGGQSNELWCPGGEAAFLQRMIDESARIPGAVGWFSSLVAKSEHLRPLRTQLQRVGAREVREVAMAQGSKQSRFLAWTFLAPDQRIAARA